MKETNPIRIIAFKLLIAVNDSIDRADLSKPSTPLQIRPSA